MPLILPEADVSAIRAAVAASEFGTLKRFEIAAGLEKAAAVMALSGRASPQRVARVLAAFESVLGIRVAVDVPLPVILDHLAALEAKKLISPNHAAAGRAFAVMARPWSWPGIAPDDTALNSWPKRLRAAWRALRPADADAKRRRLPLPSLVLWRITANDEAPLILDCREDREMAQLELSALRAGLMAVADNG